MLGKENRRENVPSQPCLASRFRCSDCRSGSPASRRPASDQQLASFRDLAQARASAADTLRRQLEDRQRALSDALSLPTPDPGTAGNLVITINSLQKQFGQIEAGFRNGFLGLLSDEQKSKLEFIQSVEAALRAAGALHQLGL